MAAFLLIPNPVSIPGFPFLAQVFHIRNMFLIKTILLLEKVQNKILLLFLQEPSYLLDPF